MDIRCDIVNRKMITSCRYSHWPCLLWSYLCTYNNFVIKWGCANGIYPVVLADDVKDDTIVDLHNSAFVAVLLVGKGMRKVNRQEQLCYECRIMEIDNGVIFHITCKNFRVVDRWRNPI